MSFNSVVMQDNSKFRQQHGQKIYGPPLDWTGPPPPKGCEVFIGKLPRFIFEDTLFPMFERIGTIYQFRLMMDFSKTTRGFAFVKYTNLRDARKAIEFYNNYEILQDRRIVVLKSVDNSKLYIGGIPSHKTRDEVFREFSLLTAGVVNVELFMRQDEPKVNRGFCFVDYESHRAASLARRILLSDFVTVFKRTITVDWATPEPDVEEENLNLLTVLYVRNIPAHIDEDSLRHLFSFGGKLKVGKVKKQKSFAFIHYFWRNDAEKGLAVLNGYVLDDCEIEVKWAKPPNSQRHSSDQRKKAASGKRIQLLNNLGEQKNFLANMDFFPCDLPQINIPGLQYPGTLLEPHRALESQWKVKQHALDQLSNFFVDSHATSKQSHETLSPQKQITAAASTNDLKRIKPVQPHSVCGTKSIMNNIGNKNVFSDSHLGQDTNMLDLLAAAVSLVKLDMQTQSSKSEQKALNKLY